MMKYLSASPNFTRDSKRHGCGKTKFRTNSNSEWNRSWSGSTDIYRDVRKAHCKAVIPRSHTAGYTRQLYKEAAGLSDVDRREQIDLQILVIRKADLKYGSVFCASGVCGA